jgi:hypothetical protein
MKKDVNEKILVNKKQILNAFFSEFRVDFACFATKIPSKQNPAEIAKYLPKIRIESSRSSAINHAVVPSE